MKTLLVLATHFIDEAVISEYRKMKNTPGVDAVLAIDNTNAKIEFKSRVENKIFFDTSVKCFFFDSALHDELNLPYLVYPLFVNAYSQTFARVMWGNCDYKFYYVKKFFSEYDYYWQIEYDVFCNAETYAGFLNKFNENRSDLLITHFNKSKKNNEWNWTHGLEWIYKDVEIYGCTFQAVRLSSRAVDFLYQRRLEHRKIFESSTSENKNWVGNEVFAPTELMNAGFTCEKIDEKNMGLKNFYLNDERFFLQPDNCLYHPVKSVKAEISKMQAQYNNLFLLYRKVFLTSLVDKLISISAVNVKDFPMQFDKDFNYVIFTIPKTGGGGTDFSLRYEAKFMQEKIFVNLVFDGSYEKNFAVINQCGGLNQLQTLQVFQTPTGKILAYTSTSLDDVSQVANAMKILIESTYPILQEKIL